MSDTVLDGLVACLQASMDHNPDAQEAPVALLWPDEGGHWQQVIDRVAGRLPVLTLGTYDGVPQRGPGYWIRCVIAGTVDTGLADGIPIVYLPGVARGDLRAVDSCPPHLAPIAELQYRSQWFSHPNGRDWTPWALLSHRDRGLGLRLLDSAETVSALQLALGLVLDESSDRLKNLVIDPGFLHDLVSPDPVRNLLGWLDDPAASQVRSDLAQWEAFLQQCRVDYGFEPMLDGEITAARLLGQQRGKWADVWRRFAETPERYPGIVGQLRKARPETLMVDNADAWPQDNEMAEDKLRHQLADVAALPAEGARTGLARLEADHAWRRGTVWADLDQAPLAFALEQLATLAELTVRPLASGDLADLMADYVDRGWRTDDTALRALAVAHTASDRNAVGAVVVTVYRPWLDQGARALQALVGPLANSGTYHAGGPPSTTQGTAVVFVDGLRFDIAQRVVDRLGASGLDVDLHSSLAALPTVTQTAKPALVPVDGATLTAGPELHAANADTGTRASIQVLRALMADHGVQVLGPTETGDSSGVAWTEVGELDHRGHDVGSRLVDYLDEEVGRVVGRVRELLEAGWQRVELVTDHGWILLPGGLERVELPPATTEVKKGRCARLKEGAVVDVPTVPWFWDPDVRIAVAPGIACFEANKEYEHGGVSPQECIVPRLTVTVGLKATLSGPEILSVKWLGLLCRIEVTGVGGGVKADLRALPADSTTSIADEAKETVGTGKVSLLVPDEEHEGERAHVVLVAPEGQILAQREVMVGRNQ